MANVRIGSGGGKDGGGEDENLHVGISFGSAEELDHIVVGQDFTPEKE